MNFSAKYRAFLLALESLHLTPDNIRESIKELCDKFSDSIKEQSEDDFKRLILESELIHVNKSISGGLTPTMSGTRKNEDGEEEEVIWPDYRKYSQKDQIYLLERFKTSSNDTLKNQYGLYSIITDNLRHNDLKEDLVKSLINEALNCYGTIDEAEKRYKFTYQVSENLRNAFHISVKSRFDVHLSTIINFIHDELKKLKPSDDNYFAFFYLLTDLFFDQKKIISKVISVEEFLDKTFEDAIIYLDEGELSGSLILLKKGLAITSKVASDQSVKWMAEIARALELSGDREVERKNYFGVSHYQDASEYYKQAGNTTKEQEVLSKYEQSIGKTKLDDYSQELTEEQSNDLNNWIDKIVKKKEFGLILGLWTLKPNISAIKKTMELTEEEPESFFLKDSPQALLDKTGATAEFYKTKEEKRIYRFWEQFGMELQLSAKIAYVATLKSLDIGAINSQMVVAFLRGSWLNEPMTRFYNGEEYTYIPNDLIIPGVGQFFHCLEEFVKPNTKIKSQDFVPSIDSMSLKVEYILRCACKRVGINTTILKESNNKYMVPQHKVLSHLFRNLEQAGYFDEKETKLFEYLFLLREHDNIRNDAAHGLLDLYEYGPFKGLRILGCIMLLAINSFIQKEN